MLFSVQVPLRGDQCIYERVVELLSLVDRTEASFELVVCHDRVGKYPSLKPLHSPFPQTIVEIPDREPGWGYPVARNACLDFADPSAEYLVNLDADWVLDPGALREDHTGLSGNHVLSGYKHYRYSLKRGRAFVYFPELAIYPIVHMRAVGGWDEVFFPRYSGYWHDLMRRLSLRGVTVRKDVRLVAVDLDERVHHERDASDGKALVDELAQRGTREATMRRRFPVQLVHMQP